jgi:pimeloyl-ACP methyl ester carboxylesterase
VSPSKACFEVEFEGRALEGDVLGPDLPHRVLMLHGGGEHHRGKMHPLRLDLAERGVGSWAFDFIGHGETGGDLRTSSLEQRTEQAVAVIDALGLAEQGPLALSAASMGAHTAVELLERYDVDRLVLVVPAMYATAARSVRFDQGFSEIIRRPESWRDARGWEILGRFRGRLLVIAAELDDVIPKGVVELYGSSAINAAENRTLILEGVGHMCFTELRSNDPPAMQRVVDRIADLIRSPT